MRVPCLLLALLCLLCAGCGDDEPILVVEPAVHDFGRVRFGLQRVTQFKIRNTSDKDVELLLKPNCGCFKVLDGGRRSLEPGQTSTFRIRFDAGPPLGPQKLKGKRLDVITDNPEANTAIPLEGEIYQLATLVPAVTRVGRLNGDASTFEPRRIELRPTEKGAQVKIESVSLTPPDIFAVTPEGVEDGIDLVVRLNDSVRRKRTDLLVLVDVRATVTSAKGATEVVSVRSTVSGYWDADTTRKKK